jgi:DNA-directed RNA polymerase subunit L
MELEILEDEDAKIVFKLHGAGHTFCNALKDELADYDDVDIVTYTIKHPLVAEPKFFLETHGEDPVNLMQEAVESLRDKNNSFEDAYTSLETEA